MKKLILIALLSATTAQAGWFSSKPSEPDAEMAHQKELRREQQIAAEKERQAEIEKERRVEAESKNNKLEQRANQQQEKTQKWQLFTASLAIASVVLFTFGIALGSGGRRDGKKS